MLSRILLLNFEIEDSNIETKGILFSQHYYIKDKTLTILFPQKADKRRGMSLDFELTTDTYGLFAVLTFCFGLKINDSFKGYLFTNNTDINKILNTALELDNLKAKVLACRVVSNLDGSDNTPGFSNLSNWPRKNFRNLVLSQEVLNDITVKLHEHDNPPEIYTLLDYWRRGFDLELLHYGMEAFLNFFKIIESIIGKNPKTRSMDDGWIMSKASSFRMKSVSRKIILYRNIRNRYNVGHPVRSIFIRRDYGHYLNSFDDDIWNHISDIAEVSKCLLLKSICLNKYKLVEDGGLWFLGKRDS